jgi:glycosyltransferase involved in cell wall biosynthesis
MLASELSGIPFSFTAHGPEEFFRPYENALSEKIARARLVVAISHFCRSQLMLFSDPAQWDKISIVHCGIEPELYVAPPRETFGKRVLFVGRLTPEKGGALLLEAFAQVFAAHPEARLTVVGDGPERPALEARAQALGVAEAVTFAGARNQLQVAAHMAEADMLVLPSFAEGVPVVLMEAMAAGLPTIASRVAGVSELVHDEETGFVIPPGDLETLANRLSRLMSNPNLCRNMGASGRAVVEADYVVGKEAAWLARLLAGSGEGTLRPVGAEPS